MRPTVEVVHGDCGEVLAAMTPDTVDAVVTDPPWNLGKSYGGHDDAMAPEAYVHWLAGVLRECARVAHGPVVFLPGAVNAPRLAELLVASGLVRAAQLTWRKPDTEPVVWTMRPPPAGTPRRIDAPEPAPGGSLFGGHPCPKPRALLEVLVAAAVPPGGTVLDPFAGTGTTLLAARATGRSAIGVEREERFCAVTRRRLADAAALSQQAAGYRRTDAPAFDHAGAGLGPRARRRAP